MKRIVLLFFVFMLVSSSSFAAEPQEDIDIIIDDQTIETEVPPRLVDDRTLVPVRDVFENLGAEMKWDPEDRVASGIHEDQRVDIPIDSKEATVNETTETLDVPAQVFEERTYVPLRFSGEALDGEVDWDGDAREITIDPPEIDDSVKVGELTAHFIDVGQGDAIFLETPCDNHVLVDGGQNWEGDTVVSYIENLGINEIEKVVASHPHADHIGGLSDVYQELDVEVIYDNGYERDTQTYEEYYELANQESDFRVATQGDTLDVDSIDAEFIHPPEGHTGDIHDLNLVLDLDFEGQSILLTGDAEIPSEEMMMNNSPELLPSELLKVGHHGSSTSTGDEFLDAVDPEAAVIQVGEDNRYGHPDAEVLQRLQENDVKIYRNDYHEDVVITLDENSWSANVEPWDGEVIIEEDEATDEPDDETVEEPVGRVNINTASYEELQEIINIGEARAEEIIELRPFNSLDELDAVHGLADATIEEIKEEGIAYVE
ncbi:stalk domain-containing protein [Natranaerofaba carboxydovora]|uniref:stalk domain-containing protein n=1 Tax=Natranaerofaba carboxydovora TaxID=2742683 RepID=UPI001F139A83|nr:stalk domain-containing protein [Natranaerofaba carboxydovora]UMZ74074.1 ComE operon protein 3 [Natranaerofaba carboxydovora]